MKLVSVLFVVFGLSSFAFAQSHEHSPQVCSAINPSVCAHIGMHEKLNSTQEGHFVIHFIKTQSGTIENLRADLWMDMGSGHGHGSAPLTIVKAKDDFYNISNAWFVMPGQWLVRINFDFNGLAQTIEIPLQINE